MGREGGSEEEEGGRRRGRERKKREKRFCLFNNLTGVYTKKRLKRRLIIVNCDSIVPVRARLSRPPSLKLLRTPCDCCDPAPSPSRF